METMNLVSMDRVDTKARKPSKRASKKASPRAVAKGVRKKAPARKRFDMLFGARLFKEQGRKDVVKYLAEKLRTSSGYISRVLDNKTPRQSSSGRDFPMWAKLKDLLLGEEIELLEELEGTA